MSTTFAGRRRYGTKLWLALAVFVALFGLLFQYRLLSLLKRLGADASPIGTKFPLVLDVQNSPPWLVPIYGTIDYLNSVWFTTLLGLFIGGAAITFLPGILRHRLSSDGWRAILAGALLGLPNMFCTCCAATTLPAMRKTGAATGGALAFFVSAPSLNIVVILLGFQLLPMKLAIIRMGLGLVAAIGVTYIVARLKPAPMMPAASAEAEERSVRGLLAEWVRGTWYAARIALPLLVAGIFVISVLKVIVPVETLVQSLGEGFAPTLIAATVGTLLMVPTFTEVLWVSDFTKHGMGVGPAIALLITLPAVSLPSLIVLGQTFRSPRLGIALGAGILALGLVAGLVLS